jgi:hypothetical protein
MSLSVGVCWMALLIFLFAFAEICELGCKIVERIYK